MGSGRQGIEPADRPQDLADEAVIRFWGPSGLSRTTFTCMPHFS
jgi:hypothetical protein